MMVAEMLTRQEVSEARSHPASPHAFCSVWTARGAEPASSQPILPPLFLCCRHHAN